MITIKFGEKVNQNLALALGFFDSVHLGHQKIITSAKEYARKNDCLCAVFTFENNPFLQLNENTRLVFTLRERLHRLNNLGVDMVILQNFDQNFMSLEKTAFLKALVENYNIKSIFCGPDYRFGAGGAGDINFLSNWLKSYKIDCNIIDFVEKDGRKVSSTDIRKFLQLGDLKKANELLGEPYFLIGRVLHGRGEGKQLGVPTINFKNNHDKVLPKDGVYVTQANIEDKIYPAVTNLGIKPTYDDFCENVESHIINFKGNLYDKDIKLSFLQRIRDIQKFEDKELLKQQIQKDIKAAIEYKDE